MDAISEGDKIFRKVVESINWTETSSLQKAHEILKKTIF